MTADTCACDAQPTDDDRQCPACGASVTGRQVMDSDPSTWCAGVIDVAHWDSDDVHGRILDALTTAAANGIVGVIAKATQGRDYVDPTWPRWVAAAKQLGMLFGAYHFASNTSPGAQQADWFLAHVTGAGCDLATTALALDFERNPDPHLTMTVSQAREFAERIHSVVGRWPLLYGDVSFHSAITDPHDSLGNCPLWPAMYGGGLPKGPHVPPAWREKGWTLWQYTDGTYCGAGLPRMTPGFGGIDRSVYRGTADELRRAWPGLAS